MTSATTGVALPALLHLANTGGSELRVSVASTLVYFAAYDCTLMCY